MRIGIIGTGSVGKTLALKLSKAGHKVKITNSRGPDTIEDDILKYGIRAVAVAEVFTDVDVAIFSIPPTSFATLKPLLTAFPKEAIAIDTSNYYPQRDGKIISIEKGEVESVWVSEQLGRPVIKAWNAIGAGSLANKGQPKGHPDRIAIPVAGIQLQCEIVMTLVEDTGFDGYYASNLSESWQQQPGSPAYCTNLSIDKLVPALNSAEKHRLPKRRDIVAEAMFERGMTNVTEEYFVTLNRAVFL